MGIRLNTKEKGFTIIEVVLVLAIAGLIFMMVFIALPALQRSQRDTQRKNDLNRAQTAVVQYASNNRGAIPTNWTTFETTYLINNDNDSFIDPLGASTSANTATMYVMVANNNTLAGTFDQDTQNVIYYSTGYTCDGTNSSAVKAAGNRKVSLRMYLEAGGVYCINN